MARELTMPKLSDSMADAVIVRWLKPPGDGVRARRGLIEVETDKATVVYEAESDGTLDSILVPEGATVASGADRDARERWRDVPTEQRRAPSATAPLRRDVDRPGSVPTRRRWRDAPRSSSACRSRASRAPARAAGSRARTSRGPRPARAPEAQQPAAAGGRDAHRSS